MVNTLKALLLRNIKDPVVRSFIVNAAITVAIAAVTTLQGELTDGRIDFRIIYGAAVAALLKWAHSSATTLANEAEARLEAEAGTVFDPVAALSRLNAAEAPTPPPAA